MHLQHLLLSLLLFSGFYYIGKKIIIALNLRNVVGFISDPFYQNTSFGIVFFILIFYPIFFLKIYSFNFFVYVSYIVVLLGIINFLINFGSFIKFFKKEIYQFRNKSFLKYLIYINIILFFLLSISPITSGDSISYHMGSAKYILENSQFDKELFFPAAPLAGAGEFLNAFALSINAYQFTSLINFIGIMSLIGILIKLKDKLNLKYEDQYFLILCILSCPILIFLVSSSKSQLFSVSLIMFSYALIIHSLIYKQNEKNLEKFFYILVILPIVAVQTKISFSLSFFLIIATFFLIFFKKIQLNKFVFIFCTLFVISLLPMAFWKETVYGYPFYNFLINPFPTNIPGFDEIYNELKNYEAKKFPLILFVPLGFSDLTQFIGLGLLLIFFLIKFNFEKKKNNFISNNLVFNCLFYCRSKNP